ncbi:MAG: Gfo/Idh/MocA family oxidoreductase [Sphingomonas sp.]|nr:Gfo/Idh/MocA family oxidoreductase [Sphingomonas sp.]
MSGDHERLARPLRVAIVGLGKIARDAHLPAIAENSDFDLVATVDPRGGWRDHPAFHSLDHLLESGISIDAVSICTPPDVRFGLAARAIARGIAVMLEKPPAVSVAEAKELERRAVASKVGLFTAWHARMAPGLAPARNALADRTITSGRVVWREDVRQWHPGQEWIFGEAGFGVFDPAINAISLLTAIDPSLSMLRSRLFIPAGRASPIRAEIALRGSAGGTIDCSFDFLWPGEPLWTIELSTNSRTVTLEEGAHRLAIDGNPVNLPDGDEYGGLYRKFAHVARRGIAECDVTPLALVERCLTDGARFSTRPFGF